MGQQQASREARKGAPRARVPVVAPMAVAEAAAQVVATFQSPPLPQRWAMARQKPAAVEVLSLEAMAPAVAEAADEEVPAAAAAAAVVVAVADMVVIAATMVVTADEELAANTAEQEVAATAAARSQ